MINRIIEGCEWKLYFFYNHWTSKLLVED